MKDSPILTISIVNWNSGNLLKDCINSIYKNMRLQEIELIVIDNNSSDNSLDAIKNLFPSLKIIKNTVNKGFGAANNQAIKLCKTKYVLIINPDIVILPNTHYTLIDFMEKNNEIAIAGGQLLNLDFSIQRFCRSFPTIRMMFYKYSGLSKLFPKSKEFGKYEMGYWDYDSLREVDQPPGAFLMIRRDVLEKIGYFDERFFMFFEDVDLCLRIKKAGYKIFYVPNAKAIHIGAASINKEKEEMNIEFYKSMIKFHEKHYSSLSLILLKIIIFVSQLLLITKFLFVFLSGKINRKEFSKKVSTKKEILKLIFST